MNHILIRIYKNDAFKFDSRGEHVTRTDALRAVACLVACARRVAHVHAHVAAGPSPALEAVAGACTRAPALGVAPAHVTILSVTRGMGAERPVHTPASAPHTDRLLNTHTHTHTHNALFCIHVY